jgi:DNA polymerase-3 subunit beta
MDIYIDRDELSATLTAALSVVERRAIDVAAFAHVLLDATGDGLVITAANNEFVYSAPLVANVQRSGNLSVDATTLAQTVRSLPEPTVRILATKGGRVTVTSGRASFTLPASPSADFPKPAEFTAANTATIAAPDLRRLIETTAYAVAQEDHRFGLNGLHLETYSRDGTPVLRAVATDGHRLSGNEAEYRGDLFTMPRRLIPRKATAVLRKLLPDDGDVLMAIGDGAMKVEMSGRSLWVRLLEGEFPDYRMVVPEGDGRQIRMRVADLLACIKRVSILTNDRARATRFEFGASGEVTVSVHNADKGEITETLACEIDCEPIAIGFNVAYLAEVLPSVGTEEVCLQAAHALAPCLVRPVTEDGPGGGFFAVVMPMRLD